MKWGVGGGVVLESTVIMFYFIMIVVNIIGIFYGHSFYF